MLSEIIEYAKNQLGDDYDYSGFAIAISTYDTVYGLDSGYAMEKKFADKFCKGFFERPSRKISIPTRTVPDFSTDSILYALIDGLDESKLSLIRYAHRISMAADSIIGMMLLEYLHVTLHPYGWTCCWGNSLQGIDFCSRYGDMLHIRNKSNSEISNNEHNRTKGLVKKWFRMNAYTGKLRWTELNSLVREDELLSEEGFRNFVYATTKDNPESLYTGKEEAEELSNLISKCRFID